MCLKEIEGGETGGVEFELPMECANSYVQVDGCVSRTYGKSSELEIFNCTLSAYK